MIHSAAGYFKEKYAEKYLILDSTEKYDEVFSEIKKEIETINGGKELFYEKNYARIGVNTDDDVPLNKPLEFPTLTTFIRRVFQEGEKLYPQIYLDECLYKMLEYEKTDISDGIDVYMSDKSKKCMLCHYWYFLDKNFSYGPYPCDGCYNIVQKCNKLKNIAIAHVKKCAYRIYFLYMSKREAKKLMTNSNLIDKKGVL